MELEVQMVVSMCILSKSKLYVLFTAEASFQLSKSYVLNANLICESILEYRSS